MLLRVSEANKSINLLCWVAHTTLEGEDTLSFSLFTSPLIVVVMITVMIMFVGMQFNVLLGKLNKGISCHFLNVDEKKCQTDVHKPTY